MKGGVLVKQKMGWNGAHTRFVRKVTDGWSRKPS